MDYRYEISDSARSFHERRRAFVIINKRIEFLPKGSTMSHYEFCQTKGLSKEEFNRITRGYYLDGKAVFYKGNFIWDEEVIKEALLYLDLIAKEVLQNEFDLYFGQPPEKNWELDYHYGKYEKGRVIKND